MWALLLFTFSFPFLSVASDFQWEIETPRPPAGKQFRLSLTSLKVPCAGWKSAQPKLRARDLVVSHSKLNQGAGCKFLWIIFPATSWPRVPIDFELVPLQGEAITWTAPLKATDSLVHEKPCPEFRREEFECTDLQNGKKVDLPFDLYKKADGEYYRKMRDETVFAERDRKEYPVRGKRIPWGFQNVPFDVFYRCEGGIYFTNSEGGGLKTESYYKLDGQRLIVRGDYLYQKCENPEGRPHECVPNTVTYYKAEVLNDCVRKAGK